MDYRNPYTLTGSWLNNSFMNIQGDPFLGPFDITDFANLDAPDYLAAGSTHKVRRIVEGSTTPLIAARTARRD